MTTDDRSVDLIRAETVGIIQFKLHVRISLGIFFSLQHIQNRFKNKNEKSCVILNLNTCRVTEDTLPGMCITGPDCEVVLMARKKLLQGAGHGQRKSFHVAHLFPKTAVRLLVGSFLVREELIGGNCRMVQHIENHVPAENHAFLPLADLQGRLGRDILEEGVVGLWWRVGQGSRVP